MVFGVVASIVGSIGSAISSIGPAVSSFCTNILPKIITTLEQYGPLISNIANMIFNAFDVFKPGEGVEEMGDRAMQAAEKGITPEKFDDFEAYTNEIRDFKLDAEKSSTLSAVEKLAAGLAVGTLGVEKKLDMSEGSLGSVWLLAASSVDSGYFNAARLIGMLQSAGSVSDILSYFEGKLGPADNLKARDIAMDLERQNFPGKGDESIYAEIMQAKDAVSKVSNAS